MQRDETELRERLLQALGGAYDFERELGGAGMSRVFVAVEKRFERRVVVKVLAPELAAGVSAERFAREVALAARLQQANIVPVFDSGEVDGLPYYTMPWVEGESLRTRLDARGSASIADTVAILSDVARALSYAHSHGVVHRDIKPENILLSGHTAVVTDFGIAKALHASRTLAPFETITQVGTSLGTPAYMAPEQAMGDPATDHRADLYALGVVAYEMLAGERPFTGATLHELIRAHVTQTPQPLLARRREIPAYLAAAVMRCLEKDPAHRPASADVLLETLTRERAAPDDLPVVRTAPRMSARGRTMVVASLAVVFVAALVLWRRERAPARPLDSMRVLVAPPATADPSLSAFAEQARSATARALGQIQSVRVAERRTDDAAMDDDDAVREARRAQARFVVTSTVHPQGPDSARVELRLLDAQSGELLRAMPPMRLARSASDGDWGEALGPLLSTAAIATFPLMGPTTLPVGDPPRYAATRELLTALSLGTRTDSSSRGAMIVRAQRATELDSTFTQAFLWSAALRAFVMVTAYSPLTRAYVDSVIRFVEPHRDRLTPFESAMLDYVVATRRSEHGSILTALRRLQGIAPEVILTRNLPQVLLDVNRPREALGLLQSAPRLRTAEGQLVDPMENPFHVTTLCEIHHYLGDYAAARAAAAQLRRIRPDELNSVRQQLSAAAALGDSAAIEALLSDARTMQPRPSSYNFFGDLALQTGQELRAHGHDAFGERVVRRALEWFETRTPSEMDWRVRLRHALAYHELGDERRAAEIMAPLLSFDSTGVLFIGLHGRLAAARRDTVEVRRVDSTLAAMGTRIGGSNTLERAFIAANLGQRERTVQLLQESFSQGLGFNLRWRLHWFSDLRELRGYAPFDALIRPQG